MSLLKGVGQSWFVKLTSACDSVQLRKELYVHMLLFDGFFCCVCKATFVNRVFCSLVPHFSVLSNMHLISSIQFVLNHFRLSTG